MTRDEIHKARDALSLWFNYCDSNRSELAYESNCAAECLNILDAALAKPEPEPLRWIYVSERVPDEAQIVLFVLKGKVVVGAWIAGIFWYDNAKQVASAWMPLPPPPELGVGGYPITAPPCRASKGMARLIPA